MIHDRQMNRRIILFSLLLIVVCGIFSSQTNIPIENSVYYNETLQNPISSAFVGTGKQFAINQYATTISLTYNVNPTTTASFTLTDGWTAENITIDCENVTRNQDLITDGTGSSLTLGRYTYWNYKELDTGSNSLNTDNRTSMLSMDVGDAATVSGNYAYFYQSISIDDEEVSDRIVDFSFDYRLRRNGVTYNGASLRVSVIVGGVEYVVFNQGFSSLSYEDFYTINTQYYLSDQSQSLPNNVEFRFGVYINSGQSYLGERNDLHFTNIEYNIWTFVNEPNFLVAEDNDDSTDYYYQNSSAGMGYFTIPGQKSYSGSHSVIFTIRDSVSDTVLIDELNISADLFRLTNSSFSSFQDGAFSGSEDILWEFDVNPSIPVSYIDRYMEIEKPDDWEIISAVDPFLTNRTASCIDIGYGKTKFYVPTSIFSNGEWQFRARSKSWFDEAKLEFWNGMSFEERLNYHVGEEFHVKVNINDTVTLSGTYINFTIYYPNGTIYQDESEEPTLYEYYFGNYTIDSSMPVGMYTAEVAWTNNLSASYIDKVGYKTFDFNVLHHTSFIAVDSVIETVPGEALLILVQYKDTDLNQGIDLATVEYNSTFGGTGNFQYAGGGYYFLDLNTSELDYTDYYLSLNASKTYFDNHTESDFIKLTIEREGMILEVPRQVKSASANSYAQFNFNLTGEISETFLTADDITTDWIAWYHINEVSTGQYQLNVSTWDVITTSYPETFVINIFANKTNYTNTSDVVLLQVNPIPTAIAANATFIEVSQGTPFSVKVNYTDTGLGTLISGADCDATWSISPTITPSGDEFIIEYETTGFALDQYSSIITVNKSGYQTKTIIISVLINPVQTVIAANITFIRVSQGSQFAAKANYTEYYGGGLISGATCTVNWLKYYEITTLGDGFEVLFNTTELSLGQYTATIKIEKTGYETQNVFITVLVDPISTSIEANQTLITIEPGKVFTIIVNYTNVETSSLIFGATCDVTWGRDTNVTEVSGQFFIDFSTSGLALGQYSGLIQISKSGYETQNLFVSVLINPISAYAEGNITLVTVEQGKTFTIKVNYTNSETGFLITGANCFITWGRDTNITELMDEFIIDFDTTGLALGQYTAIVQFSKEGYETQSLFVTVLIEPVASDLNILFTEPAEFFVGDQAIIAIEYIVDGLSFSDGTVSLVGDIEGTLVWNGTAYALDIDTTSLDPKIYFSQIFAQAAGVQTQIYDLYIRIQPVEYDITISPSRITISEGGNNLIFITVYDSSHNMYVTDATIACALDEMVGTVVSMGNGTYSIDLNQFGLKSAVSPYYLQINVTNPFGESVTRDITVSYPRNLNLIWWIAGAVGGTILLGLSGLFIYFRYIKQNRFQREIAFVKKNITNISKIKSRTEPSREELVSEIIKKEIDQLL